MLRLLVGGTTSTKSTCNLGSKFIRNKFTANQPSVVNERVIPEKLNVTLCGKICGTPLMRDDGAIWMKVATRNPYDASFDNHNVLLSARKSEMMVDRLMEGINKRVHLNGIITYYDFVINKNENRQVANIKARNFFLCDSMRDDDDAFYDVNDVKLLGRIVAEPRNIDNMTFLEVDTRYFDRNAQSYQHRRHSLKILDESMRKHANTLINTKVVVNGRIDSLAVETHDGKKRNSVTIQPYILFAIEAL